jgi:uncharacterized protein YgiM (DUF1202 family)
MKQMKNVLFIFFLLFGIVGNANAQTSKSCGSCKAPVSANSKVGDYCPHCGVRWGYENESRTQRTIPSYTPPSNPIYPRNFGSSKYGMISSNNANVRSGPSKNYSVEYVLYFGNTVTLIEKVGDWYYLSYFDTNSFTTAYGYVHKSLINRY